jgi:hypothetical protein
MDIKEENAFEFGKMFQSRCDYFRNIEFSCIPEGNFEYPEAAHRLLSDMETCYGAKAYYATICLATSSIEIFLEQTEKVEGQNFYQLLENAQLLEEANDLRKLRNDIMHGKENNLIQYGAFDPDGYLEKELELICKKAFILVHSLPHRLLTKNA